MNADVKFVVLAVVAGLLTLVIYHRLLSPQGNYQNGTR